MPASIRIAPTGVIEKVSGSSTEIAAITPIPGSTPTTLPNSTPRKHHIRLSGCSATLKPCSRSATVVTIIRSPFQHGEGKLQQIGEEQPGEGGQAASEQ